jgi:hypothetical protein
MCYGACVCVNVRMCAYMQNMRKCKKKEHESMFLSVNKYLQKSLRCCERAQASANCCRMVEKVQEYFWKQELAAEEDQ